MRALFLLSVLLFVTAFAEEKNCEDALKECDDQDKEGSFEGEKITCSDLNPLSKGDANAICLTYEIVKANCECTCKVKKTCKEKSKEKTPSKESPEEEPEEEPPQDDEPEDVPPEVEGCFSGDVQLSTDQGIIRMADIHNYPDAMIEVVDSNNQVTHSKLRLWLHRNPEQEQEFLQITTESGHTVDMTADHLAFAVPCEGGEQVAKFAGKLKEGDCTIVKQGNEAVPSKIVSIGRQRKTGVYSFSTSTGTLVAAGVVASCYSTAEWHALSHGAMTAAYHAQRLLPAFLLATDDRVDVIGHLAVQLSSAL